jgi:hypothetical protein
MLPEQSKSSKMKSSLTDRGRGGDWIVVDIFLIRGQTLQCHLHLWTASTFKIYPTNNLAKLWPEMLTYTGLIHKACMYDRAAELITGKQQDFWRECLVYRVVTSIAGDSEKLMRVKGTGCGCCHWSCFLQSECSKLQSSSHNILEDDGVTVTDSRYEMLLESNKTVGFKGTVLWYN